MKDLDARRGSDLSLAVVRLARQFRFRRVESPVSLSQLSALATPAKEGAMTAGALAVREHVWPPSMTRVIASLAGLGFVARTADLVDRRRVLVSVSPADLVEVERASRRALLVAADLMSSVVDEGA